MPRLGADSIGVKNHSVRLAILSEADEKLYQNPQRGASGENGVARRECTKEPSGKLLPRRGSSFEAKRRSVGVAVTTKTARPHARPKWTLFAEIKAFRVARDPAIFVVPETPAN